MIDFIFDYIVHFDYYELPEFYSQEEMNKYFGEEVPIKYDSDFDILQEYVDKWIKKHNFNVEENDINYYNFEHEYVSLTAVYSFDNKFYSFDYFDYGYERYEIDCEPYEVEQITETVEVNRYVEKRR